MPRFARLLPLLFGAAGLSAQPLIVTIAGRLPLPDGTVATTASFIPNLLTADAAGNLYFTAFGRIMKLGPGGRISQVFLGGGVCPPYPGDGRSPMETPICDASSLAIDVDGNLYVLTQNRVIRTRNGIVITVAGNGQRGSLGPPADGGDPLRAQFLFPTTVAVDRAGAVYIGDGFGRIRRVANGMIAVIAGVSGDLLTTDSDLNLYVASRNGNRILKRTPDGVVQTFAGTGRTGISPDGARALDAQFSGITSIAAGPDGLYVVEAGNRRIRKIAENIVTTVAGSGEPGYGGENRPAITARLNLGSSSGASVLALGPSGSVYFTEVEEPRIRKVSNGMLTTVAGTGRQLEFPVLDEADPFSVPLETSGVAVDRAGNVYVNDGSTILRLSAQTGKLSTVAGVPGKTDYNGENLPARQAQISPSALTVAPDGSLYFLSGRRLQRLKDGVVTTAAGPGQSPCPPVRTVPVAQGTLCNPQDLAVDGLGNLYLPDLVYGAILKIDNSAGVLSGLAGGLAPTSVAVNSKGEVFAGQSFGEGRVFRITDGRLIAVAGTGAASPWNDNVPALEANVWPVELAFDPQDNLFLSVALFSRIRKLSGTLITTPVGSDIPGYNGDSVPANTARLFMPGDLAFDAAGNLYIADRGNGRIRKVLLAGSPVLSIAGGNGQRILQNERTPLPLRVSLNAADGRAQFGATVSFRVTAGEAVLSADSATIGLDGMAQVFVTSLLAVGRVVVETSASGVPPVQFQVEVTALPPPVIFSRGVVGAGLSDPPVRTLSPGGIASIFGRYFAINGSARNTGSADVVDERIPNKLDNVCVLVGGVRAPIYAIYPGQINFQVPELRPGNYRVQVITGCDTPNGLFSNEETITVAAVGPEFLYLLTSPGKKHIVAVTAAGALIGPRGALPGVETEPARAGEVVVLFAVGLGATSPPLPPGRIAGSAAQVTAETRVTIDGAAVPAERVLYVGVVPGNAGLYQINLMLPEGVASGDRLVTLTAGSGRAEGYLAVQ